MNKKSKTEERKEKERRTNPLDSFSEDLQNSIKKSRRQSVLNKANKAEIRRETNSV